jgi:hypothetical protein
VVFALLDEVGLVELDVQEDQFGQFAVYRFRR